MGAAIRLIAVALASLAAYAVGWTLAARYRRRHPAPSDDLDVEPDIPAIEQPRLPTPDPAARPSP